MFPGVRSLLATLLVLHLANSLAADVTSEKQTYRQYFGNPLARYSQASPTPCQNAGFTSGCCTVNCRVVDETASRIPCYCDEACHMPQYDDCCDDIAQIGCTAHARTSVQQDSVKASTCPDLPNPANGNVSFSNEPMIPGTEATYKCNFGYELHGHHIRNCQDDCTWDGAVPECRIRTCDDLEDLRPPKNGKIAFIPAISDTRKPVRTVAIYSCDDGYILDTNKKRRRVCQVDGTWSGSKPRCRAASCQVFPNGCCSDPNVNCNIKVTFDGDRSIECSCSIHCVEDNNCCPDVGCIYNNCSDANMDRGCCEWNTSPAPGNLKGCYVRGNGGCYCDRNCHHFNDCCADVPRPPVCGSQMEMHTQSARPEPLLKEQHTPISRPSFSRVDQQRTKPSTVVQQQSRPRPSIGEQQSVRTRPTSRAQLARYRESQAKTQEVNDRMIDELARVMSQQMENSDPGKKARWEAIVEELKRFQNS